MPALNPYLASMPSGYLFREVAQRIAAYEQKNKGKHVLSLGIGDVTRPLPRAAGEAMAKAALEMLRPVIAGVEDWTETAIHDVLMASIAEAGMKNATALWPLRIAISGKESTPGGAFEVAYLLGKEESMKRLNDAMAKL